MGIKGGIRNQSLVASLAVSLFQPIVFGAVGAILVVATAGEGRAQQTLNSEAIARIAQAITVRIEGATQGSGVLVRRDGGNRYTVLTAWHVVSGQRPGEELDIYTPDGRRYAVEQGSIKQLGSVDLATVSFSSIENYEVAQSEREEKMRSGDSIVASGFAAGKAGPNIASGFILARAHVGQPDGYQILYDIATQSGMSGGALLDIEGRLVGIHGRGEIDHYSTNREGRPIKSGINYGVPISYFLLYDAGQDGKPFQVDDKKGSKLALARLFFDASQASDTWQEASEYLRKANQITDALSRENPSHEVEILRFKILSILHDSDVTNVLLEKAMKTALVNAARSSGRFANNQIAKQFPSLQEACDHLRSTSLSLDAEFDCIMLQYWSYIYSRAGYQALQEAVLEMEYCARCNIQEGAIRIIAIADQKLTLIAEQNMPGTSLVVAATTLISTRQPFEFAGKQSTRRLKLLSLETDGLNAYYIGREQSLLEEHDNSLEVLLEVPIEERVYYTRRTKPNIDVEPDYNGIHSVRIGSRRMGGFDDKIYFDIEDYLSGKE